MKHRSRRSAYTLIEMLIASVLVAALMSAVWGMMSMYNSYLLLGQTQAVEQQLVRSLFHLLADDLQDVSIPDSGTEIRTSFIGSGALSSPMETEPFSGDFFSGDFGSGAAESAQAGTSETAGFSDGGGLTSSGLADSQTLPGIGDGTTSSVVPGVMALTGNRETLKLSLRRSSRDTDWRIPLPMEGRSPSVPEFVTIVYQFQSYLPSTSTTQGMPPGMYRIQVESGTLQFLLSQRSSLEQDLLQTDQTALDRATLEALLFAPLSEGASSGASPAELPSGSPLPPGSSPAPMSDAAAQDPLASETSPGPSRPDIDRVPEVVACRFSYFDGGSWQSEWDTTTTGRLPVAVRIQLRVAAVADVEQLQATASAGGVGERMADPLNEQLRGVERPSAAVPGGSVSEASADSAVGDPLLQLRTTLYERTVLLQSLSPAISVPAVGSMQGTDGMPSSGAFGEPLFQNEGSSL